MRYTSATRGMGRLVMAAVMGLWAGQAEAQSAWQVQSIVPGSTLRMPPALAFDSQDRPQVVYQAANGGYLQHMYGGRAGSLPAWTTPVSTTIYGSSPYGQAYLVPVGTSIYLGYRDDNYVGLSGPPGYGSVFDGSTWTPYTLPSGFSGPHGMVADGSGQMKWITTSHPSGTPAGLYLYSKSGSTDVYTPIAPGVSPATSAMVSAVFPNMCLLHQGSQAVLDTSGNLHTIQFTNAGGGQLLYANGPLGGPFTVDDNLDAGWQKKMGRPSIAVDAAGNAHIAYTQLWPYYGVKYLSWNGSGWDSEWVEQGGSVSGFVGTFPQVLLDKDGTAHVVYADLLNGLLKHAVKEADGWRIESIDSIGTQLTYPTSAGALAAAMDSRGGIGVAYWNPSEAVLKYAYLVPEPASLALLAAGGLALRRRRAGR